MIAQGVNIPKKIIPKTIGLIIMPNKMPKRIHSLFKGRSKFGLKSVTPKKTTEIMANAYPIIKIFM